MHTYAIKLQPGRTNTLQELYTRPLEKRVDIVYKKKKTLGVLPPLERGMVEETR